MDDIPQDDDQLRPSPPGIVPPTKLGSTASGTDSSMPPFDTSAPPGIKGQKGSKGAELGKGSNPWPLEWQGGWQGAGKGQDYQQWNAPRKSHRQRQRQQQYRQRVQNAKLYEHKQWEPKPGEDWPGPPDYNLEGLRSSENTQQQRRNQQTQINSENQLFHQQLQVQLGLLEESIQAQGSGKAAGKGKPRHQALNSLDSTGLDLRTESSSSSVSAGNSMGPMDSSPVSSMSRLRRNKWINRQVTRIADTGNLQRLLQTIQFHISEMNGINLATALHRVTKLVVNSISGISTQALLRHPSFQLLRATVVQHIEMHRPRKQGSVRRSPANDAEPVFEVQCMSIVCWSCATLRLHEEKLLETIADIALPCLNELKPFELSNMLWAYAKLSLGKPALLNAVSERMLNRQWGEFSMQCLSMIAWSFATEKHRDLPVFSSIACEIVANAATTRPQEIANTLWAYAKNRCVEVPLFNALAETAISHNMLWSFKSQELSNTVWAFATIGLQHAQLFEHAAGVAISKRRELSPQNIANILWAYAKLQVCRRSGLFPALLSVSIGMMPQHKPHEISAIVWAAAKAEVKLDVEENYPACRTFFNATAHMCRQRLHEFPPQALANMVEAFAIIEADFPSFEEAMARESVGRLHQFDPMALANLFRGVVLVARRESSLNSPEHERNLAVLATIGAHVALRIGELQPGDVVHVEHSLQLLGPTTRAMNTGGLDQSVLKATMRRFDSKFKEPHDGLPGQGRSLGDRTLGDSKESKSGNVKDDGSEAFLSELRGELDLDGDDEEEEDKEFGGLFEDNANTDDWRMQAPVWMPPGGKGGPRPPLGWQYWSEGGKGGGKSRGGGSPEAVMPPWNMGPQGWNPWGPEFSSPAAARGPSSSSLAPGLVGLGPAYEESSMGTLMSPMQVGWQGNYQEGNQSWDSSTGPGAWWEEPQCMQEDSDNWYNGKDSLWSSEWPQGTSSGSPSTAQPGIAEESDKPHVWKPRLVDVSCLVQMLNDEPEEQGGLGAAMWRPVDLKVKNKLMGAGENVVRLRFGVTDERVVLKRMPVSEREVPAQIAVSPNVLVPIAMLETPEDVCYLAYPYCPGGSLAEWISEQAARGRPPRVVQIVDIVLGVLQAAVTCMAVGEGFSSFRADEIFLDSEMHPRVRFRAAPPQSESATKWLSPYDAQVASGPPGKEEVWASLVFKIGLILYCLCAKTTDPYPDKAADIVLRDVRLEASGIGVPVRPDLSKYAGPQPLRNLLEKCLMCKASDVPDQSSLTDALEDIKSAASMSYQ